MELGNLLSSISKFSRYSKVYIEEDYLVIIADDGYVDKTRIPKLPKL